MMIAEIVKEFTFDSAHQLPNHGGKCARLHGHTYRLFVAVRGKIQGNTGESEEGMVRDFSSVKSIVKESVLNKLDHAFISSGQEPIVTQSTGREAELFGENGIINIGKVTTAENIAWWIGKKLLTRLPELSYIELHETPTSIVRVTVRDLRRA